MTDQPIPGDVVQNPDGSLMMVSSRLFTTGPGGELTATAHLVQVPSGIAVGTPQMAAFRRATLQTFGWLPRSP